ncbi:MAG: hypothetical protein H6Q00_3055 [Holophagaceae bacterium]|nr:hypothetical protein [Holophagaceae bacterium]
MAPLTVLPPSDAPWLVMGLMSGTSADGLDAVLVSVDPLGYKGGRPFRELLGHHHLPYPAELRHGVLRAAGNQSSPGELCILQRRLGDHHAQGARELAALVGQKAHLACLHGQTVQHRPEAGATLQLADPYLLVEALGCPVVWDLRRRDMALGGQGAPLVPLTELWLRGQAEPWIALNLGGIANATVWDGKGVRAWDLGPGMSLLDLAAQRWMGLPYDPEGHRATGRVHLPSLERWLTHPYFHLSPPKSTGREMFGAEWLEAKAGALEALPLADRLATLAAFSAEAVAQGLRQFCPEGTPLMLSGGGARHLRLRRELQERLPGLRLEDDEHFPPGAREAVSWALLGAASALGLPGNLPEVTGASRAAVLGSWVFPG